VTDDAILERAEAILRQRMTRDGVPAISAGVALSHAAINIGPGDEEKLTVYWLDRHSKFIALDEVASGSEQEASFSLRRVVRLAIERNAWMAVFVHNHPNGDPSASDPDRRSAERIDHALAMVGTFVRGHFTIGGDEAEDIRTGVRQPIFKAKPLSEAAPPPCPKCGYTPGEENAN